MSRKTFEVAALVDYVNSFLKDSEESRKQQRIGMMVMLERVLHDTGNYAGFRYLNQNEIPKESRYPGVWVDEDGVVLPYPNRFENTDDTRVQYGCKCSK